MRRIRTFYYPDADLMPEEGSARTSITTLVTEQLLNRLQN